jgi:UDP-N-acetylmuramoylalanine--D-glutamate ligase
LNGKKKDIEDLILNATVVMKSPGIPDKASIVKKLVEKGIVISEIEFAAPFTKSSYDMTGSNGKTTTTMLTYHLLKSAGLNIGLGKHWKEFCFASC